MTEELRSLIQETLKNLNLPSTDFTLEHPNDTSHGDYATNVAMVLAKTQGSNPVDIAGQIKSKIE